MTCSSQWNDSRSDPCHVQAESLTDSACFSGCLFSLPPDQECARERLLQWPESQVKTIWSRAAANVECEVHDGCVNDRHGTQVKDKPLFFYRVMNCPGFPRAKGVPVLKLRQSKWMALIYLGLRDFLGYRIFSAKTKTILGESGQVTPPIFGSHRDFWRCLYLCRAWTKLTVMDWTSSKIHMLEP